MEISLIAAISKNFAIGKNNQLPWHLPNDLKFFKEITGSHAIIMGRKTFESIGKALPNRLNIVLSNTLKQQSLDESENIIIASSLIEAIDKSKKDYEKIFLIGGEQVFNEGILMANKLYITKVDAVVNDAAAFFPEIDENIWELYKQENFNSDKNHKYNYSFCIYTRK